MVEERSLQDLLAVWRNAVINTQHPQPPVYSGPDVLLKGMTEKTADVTQGSCFVARVRTGSDGHPYIAKAIAKGANMILAQRNAHEVGVVVPDGVVYLEVDDTAVALAWLSAAWEGFPSRQLVMIGITGTDGKTSTADILYTTLKGAGLRVGLLSTLKAVIGPVEEPLALHVTTPEAPVIQRYLRRMVDAGLTHCILESTSHGLAQYRVGAIDFDIAVVTNITHEHLDYHGGHEAYFGAKARLFENLTLQSLHIPSNNNDKNGLAKTAVLNRDDSSYKRLAAITAPAQKSYGIFNPSDVLAAEMQFDAQETRFTLCIFDGPAALTKVTITSPLVGEFNIYNMLAAAAVTQVLGLDLALVQQGLQSVGAISGRMERIDRGQPFLVLVDFAHTPNALEKAIGAARKMGNGRVITVFGSAGKRDIEKRRLMAEIAAKKADVTVLTAEDPRTESLDDILTMMAAGCRHQGGVEGVSFWRVPDRGTAIHFALTLAQTQDIVLICGKGHEQSMCFGTTEYPWDDREATRKALDAFLSGKPMPDLGLPTGNSTKDEKQKTE